MITPAPKAATRRRGFTLVELLIVIAVIAIAFGLAIPALGGARQFHLQSAGRMLAADLEYAQAESITHPDALRLIRIDPATHSYWIATVATPATPISDHTGAAYRVQWGVGRAQGIMGVTISSYSLGGDTDLIFDALGAPDQSTTAAITLSNGQSTLAVQVMPGTGEVKIP